MTEKPLLLFPTPDVAERNKRKPFLTSFHKPDIKRQGDRLNPVFNQLQITFERQSIELQTTANGLIPELMLVIETIGSIEKFSNAVKKISGLEWMGEINVDGIVPDEDFYIESEEKTLLSGKLFLVMSNQQALKEMLSLWSRYQKDPKEKFNHGLNKFKDVFANLKMIRPWDVNDRYLETGISEIWKEQINNEKRTKIVFEMELWFRNEEQKRNLILNQINALVSKLEGKIISQSLIPEIAYHSLLTELPVESIDNIMKNNNVSLLKCENIMFFRPTGQTIIKYNNIDNVVNEEFKEGVDASKNPIIALLDGMPLANHDALKNRLIIDDPDNFESKYTSQERIHGTSMCSLILNGELNAGEIPINRPLYVRPILQPKPWYNGTGTEAIPDNINHIDLIHRAIKRIFEGDGDSEPISTIKIINLSICDTARQFDNLMSPFARLLDWLSEKYKVLIIISAGNIDPKIQLKNQYSSYNHNQAFNGEEDIVNYLYNNFRNRRILSPAESMNGITVGSLHYDTSDIKYIGNRFDPYRSTLPSTFSPFGCGYRNSIKPELIYYGGKQFYTIPYQQNCRLIEPSLSNFAPGNKVAIPGSTNTTNNYSYSRGTSNATALITRSAGIFYELLEEVFNNENRKIEFDEYAVVIIKAMVVHGCSWEEIGPRLKQILSTNRISNNLNRLISNWIGYGLPKIDKVLECTNKRVTVIGFGKLNDNEANIFRFPIPPSLSAKRMWRKLTITLAWLTPITSKSQKYKVSSLWFDIKRPNFIPIRKDFDWQAVRRGTVQHEIFEGERAEPIVEGDVISIMVNCKEDAAKIEKPIAFGLVVTLEVSEAFQVDIYNEIQMRIRPSLRIKQEL